MPSENAVTSFTAFAASSLSMLISLYSIAYAKSEVLQWSYKTSSLLGCNTVQRGIMLQALGGHILEDSNLRRKYHL
jgi:hypothetical protein